MRGGCQGGICDRGACLRLRLDGRGARRYMGWGVRAKVKGHGQECPSYTHLLLIMKFTVVGWLGVTVTDFSQVFGSEKRGRSTFFSVKTS